MKVLVYGTLKTGNRLHACMKGAVKVCDAVTEQTYRMYENKSFPMIIRDKLNGYPIHGEVYEVDLETLAHLDCVEGVPYLYMRDVCTFQHEGKRIRAFIYTYAHDPEGLTEVPSGDWKPKS